MGDFRSVLAFNMNIRIEYKIQGGTKSRFDS